MVLNKKQWTKKDIDNFQTYLKSFGRGLEKSAWEQRIVNTSLPCIAVPSPILKRMIKEISKGNFISFLDLWMWDNLANVYINGGLITKISDFDTMVRYLKIYLSKVDNWANVDSLKFAITEDSKESYFLLSKQFLKDEKPFVRRAGFRILFSFIADNRYIDEIFSLMNMFYEEKEYYVNMVIAWLFSECFIKQREKTINYLKTHRLNKFTINKGISKCRDSFRVSKEDKERLLRYRMS